MSEIFSELRSPEVADAARRGMLPVLPFGQIEEHGPHLPIDTDARIARAVCREAVRRLGGAPPAAVLDGIVYGYSQARLRKWPGTFVLPQALVIETLKHVLLSLHDMGFGKAAVVSVHGNHDGVARVAARDVADACGMGPGLFFPLATVADLLEAEGKAGPGGSCHAGELETSLMLHLAPDRVDLSAAGSGDRLTGASPFPSSQAFVSTWTRQESASGAYGDPAPATADFGRRLFERMAERTAAFLRWYHGVEQV